MARHVFTFIAPSSAPALRAQGSFIASLRARLNPVRVVWLSPQACDMEVDDALPRPVLDEVLQMAHAARVDAVFQPMDQRVKRLLISDMDSTMIAQECIDELAAAVGLKAHVSAITERAMNGEMDFAEALQARVALLKGLPVVALQHTYATQITLMTGARTLVQTMRHHGAKALLVSGGFTFFTARVAQAVGFDGHEANQLELQNGALTGTVTTPILGKEAKRASLFAAMQHYGIPLASTLAVGDGANDLPMIQAAGLGVAYHAKPSVQAAAPASIRFNDLTALLYLQGIPQTAWVG